MLEPNSTIEQKVDDVHCCCAPIVRTGEVKARQTPNKMDPKGRGGGGGSA